jgi:uncharacterized protein YdbL (DUF1318 family)
MNPHRLGWFLAAGAAVLAGCFYITITFPTQAIDDYAKRYVQEYYQTLQEEGDAGTVPATPGHAEDESSEAPKTIGQARRSPEIWRVFCSPVYAADPVTAPPVAQKELNLNVSTAAIRKVKEAQKERLPKLQPLYAAGTIGIDRDGNLVLRSTEGMSLQAKQEVSKLVAAENTDRASLYREIAVANDLPASDVARIQKIFAKRWIDEAPAGWWYQDDEGRWVKKPPPARKP